MPLLPTMPAQALSHSQISALLCFQDCFLALMVCSCTFEHGVRIEVGWVCVLDAGSHCQTTWCGPQHDSPPSPSWGASLDGVAGRHTSL